MLFAGTIPQLQRVSSLVAPSTKQTSPFKQTSSPPVPRAGRLPTRPSARPAAAAVTPHILKLNVSAPGQATMVPSRPLQILVGLSQQSATPEQPGYSSSSQHDQKWEHPKFGEIR